MPATPTLAPERSETRFAIAKGKQVVVKIEVLDGDGEVSEQLSGHAVDFSVHGMKFSAPLIAKGTDIRVTILNQDLELHRDIEGIVRWSRPGGREDWYHGCQFHEALPDSLLSQLSCEGYLDRRKDPRAETTMVAHIRNELAGRDGNNVEVADYSSGGLRIHSTDPCDLDKKLLLEFDDPNGGKPTLIPVRPMWQQQVDDTFLIGCCFLNTNNAALFRKVHDEGTELIGDVTPQRSKALWMCLGAAAAVGVVAAALMMVGVL